MQSAAKSPQLWSNDDLYKDIFALSYESFGVSPEEEKQFVEFIGKVVNQVLADSAGRRHFFDNDKDIDSQVTEYRGHFADKFQDLYMANRQFHPKMYFRLFVEMLSFAAESKKVYQENVKENDSRQRKNSYDDKFHQISNELICVLEMMIEDNFKNFAASNPAEKNTVFDLLIFSAIIKLKVYLQDGGSIYRALGYMREVLLTATTDNPEQLKADYDYLRITKLKVKCIYYAVVDIKVIGKPDIEWPIQKLAEEMRKRIKDFNQTLASEEKSTDELSTWEFRPVGEQAAEMGGQDLTVSDFFK